MTTRSPEVTLQALRAALSMGRMATYEAVASSADGVLALYAWNARVSAELFILLQGLEVALRNAFDRELRGAYGDDWLSMPGTPLHAQEQARVNEAVEQLQRLGGKTAPDDVVAALSFGFWVGLLQRRYDGTLWRKALYRACPRGPKLRKDLHAHLEHLRVLRNRIAHHEPVFQRHLEKDVEAITKALQWCCQTTASWYTAVVDLPGTLDRRPAVGA